MRYVVFIESTRMLQGPKGVVGQMHRHFKVPAFDLRDARDIVTQMEMITQQDTHREAHICVEFYSHRKTVTVELSKLEQFFDDVRKVAMEMNAPQVSLSPSQDHDREFSEVHGDGRDDETRVTRNLAQIRGEA